MLTRGMSMLTLPVNMQPPESHANSRFKFEFTIKHYVEN